MWLDYIIVPRSRKAVLTGGASSRDGAADAPVAEFAAKYHCPIVAVGDLEMWAAAQLPAPPAPRVTSLREGDGTGGRVLDNLKPGDQSRSRKSPSDSAHLRWLVVEDTTSDLYEPIQQVPWHCH